MTPASKLFLFISRITLGFMFFYAGISKVRMPDWSAEGYLKSAKTFADFYGWLASPNILPVTNFLNEWGLTVLGVSLILGLGVRISGALGALLMILYYFPILDFPYPNQHAYIVDEHIIYAGVLLFISASRAGRVFGFDSFLRKSFLG